MNSLWQNFSDEMETGEEETKEPLVTTWGGALSSPCSLASLAHLVAHVLQGVQDGDGVGGEFHPTVLLVPHVRAAPGGVKSPGGVKFYYQDLQISREVKTPTCSW